MKKVIFMALATVFMFSSGFAPITENLAEPAVVVQNLDQSDFGTCTYTLKHTVKKLDGTTRTYYTHHSIESFSATHCRSLVRIHVAFLNG
jgi:hypothetical protein